MQFCTQFLYKIAKITLPRLAFPAGQCYNVLGYQ